MLKRHQRIQMRNTRLTDPTLERTCISMLYSNSLKKNFFSDIRVQLCSLAHSLSSASILSVFSQLYFILFDSRNLFLLLEKPYDLFKKNTTRLFR